MRLVICLGSNIHRWRWLWISMRWERSSSRFSRLSLWFIASSPVRKRLLERREPRQWTASPQQQRLLTENVDLLTPPMLTLSLLVLALLAPLSPVPRVSFSLLSFSATRHCTKHFGFFFFFFFFWITKNLLKFMDLLQLWLAKVSEN